MKNKILTFVIGFLVGAIIATAGFIIYEKVKAPKEMENIRNQFPQGEMPGMKGTNGNFENGQMPPEKPNGELLEPEEMKENNQENTENASAQSDLQTKVKKDKKTQNETVENKNEN